MWPQLAGVSFTYRSYTLHGAVDCGLLLSALSTYLYLVKFFAWEIGYMRSIDIIVDRAGFEIQWGCLVWVSVVYTLHARISVRSPSGLSPAAAGAATRVKAQVATISRVYVSSRRSVRYTLGRATGHVVGSQSL